MSYVVSERRGERGSPKDDLLHRPYLLLNKEDDKGLGRWGVRVSKIADFETT